MLPDKPTDQTHLERFRNEAGLSVRELARQLGTNHSNIIYWERSGKIAKTEFIIPAARILGVTVEEILGEPKPRKNSMPGGKLGMMFEAATKLPRSKQDKVIAVLEALCRPALAKGFLTCSF